MASLSSLFHFQPFNLPLQPQTSQLPLPYLSFQPHHHHHPAKPNFRLSYRFTPHDSFDEEEDDDSHQTFEEAVLLFNTKEYYKCHDYLEAIWNKSEEPKKTLIHGVLQCAVGFHHLFGRNHRGAMMEFGEGLCKLRKMGFMMVGRFGCLRRRFLMFWSFFIKLNWNSLLFTLVTVDRHEWYPPPQIYTRNDGTGLWTIKPVFPSGSQLVASKIHCDLNKQACVSTTSTNHVDDVLQETNRDGMDSSTRMRTNGDHVSDDFNMESNVERKKRRLDDGFGNGSSISNRILHEPVEEKLEAHRTSVTTVYTDDTGTAAANASVAEQVIEPTLVMLEVHVPQSCVLDGVNSQHFFGTGVIVYHSQNMGLIAVDQNTVAVSASDVLLSFAAHPIEIPGEVVFLHPVHNYALVAYDPSALGPAGSATVRAAELLPEPALRRGDSVYLVGLSRSLQATSRKSIVTNPYSALHIGSAACPRYRATNMEVIELDTDFGSTFSGVLTDDLGRVQAFWGSFLTQIKYSSSDYEDHQFVRGIPIYAISEVLEKIISGAKGPLRLINGVKRPLPLVRILEAELYPTLLSKARSFGLSNDWVQVLVKKDPIRRQVLRVKGCLAGSKADKLLEQGDMILAIKEEPITCFRDIEKACQQLDMSEEGVGKLKMTIFRQGKEIELAVGTDVRDGIGTTRIVNWCGCIVQDPHAAVRALGFLPEEGHGVYVARWYHGSPAHRYGLYGLQWIVEVNGKLTPDLDSFVEVAKGLEHEEFVRIRTVHLNGKPRVLTLKQDLHYWPTWEVKFDPETAMWRRSIIKSLTTST